jgi:hypothetical protein
MAIIKKKIENLKPGRDYLISVRTKNPDLNVYSESSNSILVSIPKDTTIPDAISNLSLYASFQNVMFVFNFSNNLDIDKYEYELYDNEDGTSTPTSAGFNAANVFTVAVPNSTDTVPKSYWGRVRSVDTTGNLGPWTVLVETDQSTPLIDNQYISDLTASKITAGTIGAHTITLAGVNSILKSNNYAAANTTFGGAGWKISGDGKAIFNDASIRSSLDIGEDQGTSDDTSFHVDSNGNMWSGANSSSFSTAPFRVTNAGDITASSLTLTGLTELATGSKIFLGAGNYSNIDTAFYVDATEQFSLGDKLTWDGNSLTVQGTLKLSDGTDVLDAEDVGNIAEGLVDEFGNTIYDDGFIGGLTISANTMYYGTGSFASGSTAFFVGKNSGGQANFSLGDKLTWDGATLSITGNVVITGGTTLDDINDAKDAADDAQDTADNAIPAGFAAADINTYTTTIDGGKITAGSLHADRIVAGSIGAGQISAGYVYAGSVSAGQISGGTITATTSLSSLGSISGGSISGTTIDCLNVTVQNGYSYRAEVSFPTAGGGVGPLYSQSLSGQGVERIVRFTSLREFKENIEDMPNGLSIINNLRPRIFSWKMGEIDPVTNEPWTDQAKELMSLNRSYGFVVEEVLEAQPELVTFQPPSHELPWDEEGGIFDIDAWKPAMWNTIEVIPILVKAIQELSAKVQELESRLS